MKHLVVFALSAMICCILCCSCTTPLSENNDRTLTELAAHMLRETNTQYCCDMNPDPVHAEAGFSIWAGDHQVAFYKYNINNRRMKQKLIQIKEKGLLYILGYRYSAMVNGSFVMIAYDETPLREDLMNAFMSFGNSENENLEKKNE